MKSIVLDLIPVILRYNLYIFIIVLKIFFLTHGSLNAQIDIKKIKEDYISFYGCEKMSKKGKDTILEYFGNQNLYFKLKFDDPFISNLEVKKIFNDFFIKKLSESDLKIINSFFDKEYQKFIAETVAKGERLEKSKKCVSLLVDSLERIYLPILNEDIKKIELILSEYQKNAVKDIYGEILVKRRKWWASNVEKEKKYTGEISPEIYDYIQYSYELMENYPSSLLFDESNRMGKELKFLNDYDLSYYFENYIGFEERLKHGLQKNSCAASFALPWYDNSSEDSMDIKKMNFNAIMFLGRNFMIKNRITEIEKIDSVNISMIINQCSIHERINYKEVLNLNLESGLLSDTLTASFLYSDPEKKLDSGINILFVNSALERLKIKQLLNSPEINKKLKSIDLSDKKVLFFNEFVNSNNEYLVYVLKGNDLFFIYIWSYSNIVDENLILKLCNLVE